MAGDKVNWDSPETWQRVVAAIIASGVKVDLRRAAHYYGTTYDTLENRFRKIKKTAAELKEEVESGQRGEVIRSNPNTPRKSKLPAKPALGNVTNGRVTKTTPSKKRGIKQEYSSASSVFEDSSSFDDGSFLANDPNDPASFSFSQEDFTNILNCTDNSAIPGIGLSDSTYSFP